MKQKLLLIISFLFILGQTAYSQSIFEIAEKYKDVSVSIKYYNRTMYYPENADSNPVFVHISIKNNSTDTLRFKLADDRMFSVDFNVFTIKNTQLQQSENLKDYIDIKEPSIYYVELKFFPELYKTKIINLTSNRLTLEIKPSPNAAASSVLPVKALTSELLKPEEISPDKVVEQTIIARQKALWDQYFLYMDVEAMLQRNAAAKRKYKSVSADERARMIKQYKSDLMQSRIDNDIVAIPESFEIERTVYSKTEGTVTVTQWFKYSTFKEKKSYVYKVRQREGIWQIYDYTVTNLGTE